MPGPTSGGRGVVSGGPAGRGATTQTKSFGGRKERVFAGTNQPVPRGVTKETAKRERGLFKAGRGAKR